jgi:hypothetical protein
VNHEYTFSVGPITDPEDDSVYCYFDWGDGNNTGWLGPYSSGQIIHASHTWTQPGVYVIRAKLKDTYGAETVWSDPHPITITDNSPPSPPSITGAAKGKPGVSYLYTVQTTDPENDSLYYYVDWGDNTTSGWLGPYVSDTAIYVTHTWITKGLFNVTAKAKDTLDAESDWGTLSVTIPSMLYDIPVWSFFQWLIMQFPHAFPILRNLLDWHQIIVEGR